ncbi:MAG: peptidase M14 [Rhodothermaceae bacterium]|nr:MAG: peptidase M14 [Rhodothermaceae bacterium]
MLETIIEGVAATSPVFRTQEQVRGPIRAACEAHPDVAAYHELGTSEEGRPLYGVVLGHGPHAASLIAGAHSDEPVGPETLRTFVLEALRQRDRLAPLFERFRFVVVPHINPDGEARNRPWIERWPDVRAYVRHAFREPPGRDLEFGFPALRAENRAVSAFLEHHAPVGLHMSLHGMGFAEGAMLLIERRWAFRTQPLRDAFAAAARTHGLRLHDHNRKGEKGFFYIEPGFTTTPEGEAMRHYFHALGDDATAALFHDSSMEYVRRLGGDPLCLVTELPLFVVAFRDPPPPEPGRPAAYLAFRERLPAWRQRLAEGAPDDDLLAPFTLTPVDLPTQLRLQMTTLDLGLQAAFGEGLV